MQECVVAVGLELEVSTLDPRAQVGASLVKGDLGGTGSRERHTAGGDGEESLRRRREGCRGTRRPFLPSQVCPGSAPFTHDDECFEIKCNQPFIVPGLVTKNFHSIQNNTSNSICSKYLDN